MSGLEKMLEIAGNEITELEKDVNIEREKRIEAEKENVALTAEIAMLKRRLNGFYKLTGSSSADTV